MPTYQYACTACGHRFEAVQAFTDDSLTMCPVCRGQLRKVYGSVGVVFKGSGFYRTDSRNGKSAATAPAGDKPAEKADKPAAKSDSSSTGSGDSKPAAATSSAGSGTPSATKAAS